MYLRITISFVALLVVISTQFGCYYDNEEDLYNIGGNLDSCAVSDISYSADLVPILNLHCISCHNESSTQSNIYLETYENLAPYVADGKFMGSIKHDDGFEPMPIGGKLENCDIALFEKWIEEGALNN